MVIGTNFFTAERLELSDGAEKGRNMDERVKASAGAAEGHRATDVEEIIALLDGYTQAGDSRIKVNVVEGEGEVLSRQYHHGRCDVGSPWACGTAFDVLE